MISLDSSHTTSWLIIRIFHPSERSQHHLNLKCSPLNSSVWTVCLEQLLFSRELRALPCSSPLHPLCFRCRLCFRCSDNCRQPRSWSAPYQVGSRVRWSCPSLFLSVLELISPSPAVGWEHPEAGLSAWDCRCQTCKGSPVETTQDEVSGTGRPVTEKHQSHMVDFMLKKCMWKVFLNLLCQVQTEVKMIRQDSKNLTTMERCTYSLSVLSVT